MSFEEDSNLVQAFNLNNRPVLSKRLDTHECGRCEKYTVVKTTFEDSRNLKYPIMYYSCQECGWEYVEQ